MSTELLNIDCMEYMRTLPAELTEGLRVIPATLVFDLPPN